MWYALVWAAMGVAGWLWINHNAKCDLLSLPLGAALGPVTLWLAYMDNHPDY